MTSSTTRATVLSAHLDDAVLSASAQLLRPGARVVTLFAGPPPPSIGRTRWDRITRATTSARRHAERVAEDELAVAELGCTAHRLAEPENQYRTEPPDQARLTKALRPFLAETAELWFPAGIGGHPDHVALRDAASAAVAGDGRGPAVFVYADLPYALRFGWPSRVDGGPKPDFLDAGFWLDEELAACGFDRARLKEQVVELTGEARRAKERAVRCYRSQLPALRLTPDDAPGWDSFFRYELFWELVPDGS
ncbi:N-acetylglucosaminyl deacetylase, LmbE family [Amycolatopsis xylanica]|uniref:N-acetylglucosaminyl deacetylase, LmbE family n=1 Tax=Amycolatopsis xylanica TaxID=589385 RepID=A0A1H3SBN0_9PSEU|nr:PIG-L family deacetylase [Amycolatopsis xylanica]SDZ35314.1 N-acetylglucosaminyl deacetylase, LmbE family [Amycolatopsis xylanica]